jgi:hypothetical protein
MLLGILGLAINPTVSGSVRLLGQPVCFIPKKHLRFGSRLACHEGRKVWNSCLDIYIYSMYMRVL